MIDQQIIIIWVSFNSHDIKAPLELQHLVAICQYRDKRQMVAKKKELTHIYIFFMFALTVLGFTV